MAFQGCQRLGGVAHAVDVERQPGFARRAQQEFPELGRAFAVAPVADPHQPLAGGFLGWRVEAGEVGGLVPDMDTVPPAPAAIDRRERLPEGEHAVVAGEVVGAHRRGLADRAVVGVVEQQREARAALSERAEPGDQLGRVPLVDDHEIRALDQRLGVGIGGIDGARRG